MELVLVGGFSFLLGHLITKRAFMRHIDGPVFRAEVRNQLQIAFQTGMHVAADISTVSGHEELAGLIRRSTMEIAAEVNDGSRL